MKLQSILAILIAMVGFSISHGQSIRFLELDSNASWVTQKNKNKTTDGTGIAVIRYTDLPGWIVQQSNDLVNWVDSTFLYAEREGEYLVAIFPLLVDGERRQFFRLAETKHGRK